MTAGTFRTGADLDENAAAAGVRLERAHPDRLSHGA